MTQEEILEYNKRCAEFLGGLYSKHAEAWGFGNARIEPNELKFGDRVIEGAIWAERFEKELKFHSDWNWIMEVVEKINELNKDYPNATDEVLSSFIWYKKEAVVEAINKFLIWYNENN